MHARLREEKILEKRCYVIWHLRIDGDCNERASEVLEVVNKMVRVNYSTKVRVNAN